MAKRLRVCLLKMRLQSSDIKKSALAIATATMLCSCSGGKILSIHNPSDIDRYGYIAEFEANQLSSYLRKGFILLDESGESMPYQLTHDGKLLVEANVRAGETIRYRLKSGMATHFDTICVAQIRYDFQDDLTWENDRGGYRLYGPAYRNGGGNVSGYDIWTKSVDYPVLSQRYHDHCKRGISYHKDHGNGMDAYIVGRTLGAGMNALVDHGGIVYPCAYQQCEILDNGPLRTSFKITCYPLDLEKGNVVETRYITLDKGAWLNKTLVKYSGLSGKKNLVSGIVVHKQNPTGYCIDSDKGYMAYADLTDNPDNGNGVIYIGVVNTQTPDSISYVPFNPAAGDAVGQIINHTNYTPEETFTYYWGAGWSKGGVKGMKAWEKYLSNFHKFLETPLEISIK